MIKKTTLLVLLCAIVLAGAVYYFDWKHGSAETPEQDKSKPAFSIQSSDIASFTLAHPAAPDVPPIRFEKRKDGWEIVEPLETGADQPTAQGIADLLGEARVSQTEPGTPDRLKAYGLDPPRVSLQFQLRNGATHTLLLGEKDFTGDSVYTIVDAAKNVSLLPDSLLTSSSKPLEDLRDHAVLHADSSQTASFTLKNSSGEMAAVRQNDAWKFTKPASAPADGDVVESLLSSVANAQMAGVSSEQPENLQKYGLANPSITFNLASDKGEKSTLLVGKKEGDECFARDPSRPMIFRIAGDLCKKLDVSYAALRDKQVLHFDADDASRVEIHDAHGTIVATRGGNDDWTIASPDAQKGKSVASWKIFDALTGLRAEDVLDHPPANIIAKLARPAIEVILTTKDGKQAILRVSGESGDFVYAQASGSPVVYKLKKQDFETLNFDAAQILL
ncbi:MAG: DUF4340 domain-containing protein [Candidatus Acidiferrales bacterium]